MLECNTERFRRAGTPAGGGLANGRGLAGLYAAVHHDVGGVGRLLDADTVGAMSQQRGVRGLDGLVEQLAGAVGLRRRSS